jgi:hypothetical protein
VVADYNHDQLKDLLVGRGDGRVSLYSVPAPPRLSIALTATNTVLVSWPASPPGWVLTETNRLTGAASPPWPQVSAAQYQTNDGRVFILTAPEPAQSRYYRLRRS